MLAGQDLVKLRADAKAARDLYNTTKADFESSYNASMSPAQVLLNTVNLRDLANKARDAQKSVLMATPRNNALFVAEMEMFTELTARASTLSPTGINLADATVWGTLDAHDKNVIAKEPAITTLAPADAGAAATATANIAAIDTAVLSVPPPSAVSASPTLEELRVRVQEARVAFAGVYNAHYSVSPPTTAGEYEAMASLAHNVALAQKDVMEHLDRMGTPSAADATLFSAYDSRAKSYSDALNTLYSNPGHFASNLAEVQTAEAAHDAAIPRVGAAAPAANPTIDELRADAREANKRFNNVMGQYRTHYPDLTSTVPTNAQGYIDALAKFARAAVEKQQLLYDALPPSDKPKEEAVLTVLEARARFWEGIEHVAKGANLDPGEVAQVEPLNKSVQVALEKADELSLYDKTVGEFMHHGYMSGKTSTTGAVTQHFIYNFWNPAHSILTRPIVDMVEQIRYAWNIKPYLVPVIVLLGLPVNILNHILPFKVDFRFPFLHLGTLQVPPIIRDVFKAVSNLLSFACNGTGLVINGACKLASFVPKAFSIFFAAVSKGIDDKEWNSKLGQALYSATFGTLSTIFKAVAGVCHVTGKALDATGSVAQNACAIAGSACQVFVHPKEAIKGVGQNLVGTYATVIQGVGEVVKETGLQLNQFANTANIPVVSNAIKVGGNVLAAVGVSIEAGGVGTKLLAKGKGKEGGTVIAAGMGVGAKTIYEGIKPHTIDEGGANPHSKPSLKEAPEFFLMPNKETGNKVSAMKIGPDHVDVDELIKDAKINTSLMTASKKAEVDKVRHEAEEVRKKERGEERISR